MVAPMERERLLTALSLTAATLPVLTGLFTGQVAPLASGRAFERAAWRRLWLPVSPSALVFGYLLGWALQEPNTAEGLPVDGRVISGVGVCIVLRSAWRAWASAREGGRPAVGVVGLLHPTIHVEPRADAALAPHERAAALAHEQAHVVHHDPLRIWLAGLVTDLQLGLPGARDRLATWRMALELARDEEAREAGVAGPDLAAAIIRVARLGCSFLPTDGAPTIAALLAGESALLRERVARLLAGLAPVSATRRVAGPFAMLVLVALALGVVTGEELVGGLLRLGEGSRPTLASNVAR